MPNCWRMEKETNMENYIGPFSQLLLLGQFTQGLVFCSKETVFACGAVNTTTVGLWSGADCGLCVHG